MRFLFIILSFLVLLANAGEVKKRGFLTSKWCAENGYFSDCRLESHVCGKGDCYKSWDFGDEILDELVLFVHDEGKYYELNIGEMKRYEFDEAINRNSVEIIGELKDDKIIVKSYNAPPPPKKEFFKGCL